MRSVSVAQAKAHFSELLSGIALGEEILITRHGRAIAKVSAPTQQKRAPALLKLAALRQSVQPWQGSSAEHLRALRDAE